MKRSPREGRWADLPSARARFTFWPWRRKPAKALASPTAAEGPPQPEEAPGPVVTKRPLDLPGLEQPPVSTPAPRPRRTLGRASRRVVRTPPSPPTPPPAPPAREWNLWDLERLAREQAGNAPRDEEWSALFTHLRVFATADGVLPKEFDQLVRESFGELIEAA